MAIWTALKRQFIELVPDLLWVYAGPRVRYAVGRCGCSASSIAVFADDVFVVDAIVATVKAKHGNDEPANMVRFVNESKVSDVELAVLIEPSLDPVWNGQCDISQCRIPNNL